MNMQLIYTPITAAVLLLLINMLGVNVSRVRIQKKISLGDGEDRPTRRAIRTHANAVEWIPPALLLMLIAELTAGPRVWVAIFGAVLVVSRLLHVIGMLFKQHILRRVGAGLTYVLMLYGPLMLIVTWLSAIQKN